MSKDKLARDLAAVFRGTNLVAVDECDEWGEKFARRLLRARPEYDLVAAWAEAVAALPKGRAIRLEHDPDIRDLPSIAEVMLGDYRHMHIDAESPVAALRALAARLTAEPTPEPES
jgi:hypothetical protein